MPDPWLPKYLRLEPALAQFITVVQTQGQEHIKPLHQHIAIRLVIEGGFHPDEITPHPPLTVQSRGNRHHVAFDSSAQTEGEQTVLGGLKTKNIDVVVSKQGVGPVIAISVKGTGNAFRNLTNRMEEAIGDSTNLHIMYPGLVYGFLHVLKGNRSGAAGIEANDVALTPQGEPVQAIRRYHDVLLGLTGRRLVRNDYTRYEAVSLAVINTAPETPGTILGSFPGSDSPLNFKLFFETVYKIYDLRFPYIASSMTSLRRSSWDPTSPALTQLGGPEQVAAKLGYLPRIS